MLETVSTAKRPEYRSDTLAQNGPSAKAIQRWMKASGRLDANAWERGVDLYDSWREWCEATHESRAFGPPLFCAALRGILVRRRKHYAGRGFAGFRLKKSGGGG